MKALHVLSCPRMEPLISHKSTSPLYIPKLGVILKSMEDVAQEQRTFLQYALSLFLTILYMCAWLIQVWKNALSTKKNPFRKSFIIVFSRGSSYERASVNPFWVSVFRRSLNYRLWTTIDHTVPFFLPMPDPRLHVVCASASCIWLPSLTVHRLASETPPSDQDGSVVFDFSAALFSFAAQHPEFKGSFKVSDARLSVRCESRIFTSATGNNCMCGITKE